MPLFGVFAILLAKLIGNYPLVNALSTGWISIGNIWMFGGLIAMLGKAGSTK